MGPNKLATLKQRITTLKQLFTRKETRVLATTCTGESIAKDMLADMDDKATEIIELMGKIVAGSSTADAKITEDSMKKINDELSRRQIRCETHVAALPSSPAAHHTAQPVNRPPVFKEQVGLRPSILELTATMVELSAWKDNFNAYAGASHMEVLSNSEQQAFALNRLSPDLATMLKGTIDRSASIAELLKSLRSIFNTTRFSSVLWIGSAWKRRTKLSNNSSSSLSNNFGKLRCLVCPTMNGLCFV